MMITRARIAIVAFTVISAALCSVAVNSAEAKAPILNRLQNESMPAKRLWRDVCKSNPATMQYLDSLSISCAGASFIHDKGAIEPSAQKGLGYTSISLGARSYYKLSKTSSVWGTASYTNTLRRDISQCNILDYSLLGPYTLGDTIGGAFRCQQYIISGGWSHSYGNWSVGVGADYRAETATRSRDPRINDIVSQLDLKAGASLKLRNHYIFGVNVGFTTYSQTSDVKFMNPANDIMTQVYTGLGSTFKRFGSNLAKESAHSLKRYGGRLQLIPTSATGLFFKGEVFMTEVDMYIRSLNNLPFSKTSTITGECQLGWIQTFRGGLEIAPQFQGLLLKRTGTENIFGTAAGSKYPVIGSRENYKENLLSALLSIPLTWRVQQNSLKIDIRPSAIIGREEQKLLSPSLNSSQSFFTPMASGSISMIPTQKFSFTIEGGISRRYISEQNFGFQAGIGVSYALGETALHLGVKWEHENRFYSENYNFFGTSLSIIF